MKRLATCVLLAALAPACSDPASKTCAIDSDCPSNFCKADGTCAPADVDAANGGDSADASQHDAGPSCVTDGTVTADEYPAMPNARADFRIAQNVAFGSAGASVSGTTQWDFTLALSGDTDVELATLPPTGAWWADDFPVATYAARLSSSSDLLGVFRKTATEVQLLGVVSPTDGITRTRVTYDPPVPAMKLPLTATSSWSASSSISGLYNGAIVAYSEDYMMVADGTGVAKTPYGSFPVIRVRTELTKTVGAFVTNVRSYAFVAECFGTVAAVTSPDNPSAGELTQAAEVKRLIP